MPQEVRLLRPFAPKLDGEGQRVDSLLVASDERATKVNAPQVMFLRLQVRDLADVVTAISQCCSQTIDKQAP